MLRKLIASAAYGAIRAVPGLSIPSAIEDVLGQAKLVRLMRDCAINCVLDVGAHHGWFAARLRRAGYRGQIFSFEPFPESVGEIQRKAANDPAWSVLPYALGDEEAQRAFNVLLTPQGGTTMNSFLQPAIDFAERRSVTATIRRFDSVAGELLSKIPEPKLFLKMDTQGFDLAVLRGVGAWLDKVQLLQSEISVIPIYQDMPHYTEALQVFEGHGFAPVDLVPVNRTPDGRTIEFDCILKRAPLG